MNPSGIGGIGVQQILPRTGTAWENQNPVPAQPDNSAADDAQPAPDRAPTPDGVGRIVDKLV
jgi:hypothetical protein